MHPFFFYFFATLLILSGLAVVLARNPVYSVLSLVAAIFSLASLFILLEAFFVGIILLMVYAGAVLVLFLFVVMLLNLNQDKLARDIQRRLRRLGPRNDLRQHVRRAFREPEVPAALLACCLW